jgi:hypothetical protein
MTAGRALVPVVALLAVSFVGSAARRPAAATEATSATGHARPTWNVGDRWTFEWRSGGQAGTRDVEVVRATDIRAVRYYVVRIGDLDFYLTPDLHWAASARDSVVESRVVPPRRWFAWPLVVGTEWEHRSLYEAATLKTPQVDRFSVVKAEPVEVPAGRFDALKVVRREDGPDFDEYWYAPEARWYVRWVGRRGAVEFEERLTRFTPVASTPQSRP